MSLKGISVVNVTMEVLRGLSKVRIYDYSEFESGRGSNGGCYGYWTDYDRTEDGRWEQSFDTTAEFPYCPVAGRFCENCKYDEDGNIDYACGEFEVFTDEELMAVIAAFKEDDDNFIEVA